MRKSLLTATTIVAISTSAHAYDRNQLVFGLGATDSFDKAANAAGTVEWRGKAFEPNSFLGLANFSPQAGLIVDVDGGAYLYGGLLYDWNFYDRWSLVPSLSVGAYNEGDSKDLGGWFEIRSAIEVNYRLTPNSRLGLNLAHISNASVYDDNPGREDLFANYSFGF